MSPPWPDQLYSPDPAFLTGSAATECAGLGPAAHQEHNGEPPIAGEAMDGFLGRWNGIPVSFVDEPGTSLENAHALIEEIGAALLKSVDPGELERVIDHVHGGRRWIDADISAAAMMDDCPLTDRELGVLRLTADGPSVREISDRLHLASGTVRNYLASAMQKTGGPSRHAAALITKERGLAVAAPCDPVRPPG
jgi:DNA-binding CsgD family transcriptional regulator